MKCRAADSALLQDALADAREHLSTALAVAREKDAELKESDALKTIVDEYGTPEETASAYKEVETAHVAFVETGCKTTVMVCPLFRCLC